MLICVLAEENDQFLKQQEPIKQVRLFYAGLCFLRCLGAWSYLFCGKVIDLRSFYKLNYNIMFCSNCGKQVPEDSNFCMHCGYSISGQGQAHNPNNCEECQRELIEVLTSSEDLIKTVCPKCDEDIRARKCPSCHQSLKFGGCRCSYCGASWYSDQTKAKPTLDSLDKSIKCLRCGSTNLTSNKKGFSVGKAIAGNFVAPGIGLLAGGIGGGKIKMTCLKCGNQWNV